MTRQEMIESIADHLEVRWVSYGTWKIIAEVLVETESGKEMELKLSSITHNEEDRIGIFDGEKYNFLCGCSDMKELECVANENGMTVEEFQILTWSDSANPNNYEPEDYRRMRVAEKLYDEEFIDVELIDYKR